MNKLDEKERTKTEKVIQAVENAGIDRVDF